MNAQTTFETDDRALCAADLAPALNACFERHGTPPPERSAIGTQLSALPTWPQLATIPEATLRACLLGFRARYISQTAQFLAAHPGRLEAFPVDVWIIKTMERRYGLNPAAGAMR